MADFNLYHIMAGVRVKITVDNSEELAEQYDLSKAKVYLTEIVHKPYQYDRKKGSVTIASNPDYALLTLVDNIEDSNNGLTWEKISTDNEGKPIYLSNNFILPPQKPSEHWPRLVIRFPNPGYNGSSETQEFKEFSGAIDRIMYMEEDNSSAELSFLPKYILEIRARITNEPPQLIFDPVRVYDWVDKGTFNLTGNQEGIYSPEDLLNIIKYYSEGNTKMLARLGELKTIPGEGSKKYWVFNLFKNFIIKKSQIAGKMPITDGMADFYFEMHRYKITVTDDNGEIIAVISTSEELHALLSYGILATTMKE